MDHDSKSFWTQALAGIFSGVIVWILVALIEETNWLILLYSLICVLFYFLTENYAYPGVKYFIQLMRYKKKLETYNQQKQAIIKDLIEYMKEKKYYMVSRRFLAELIEKRYKISIPEDPKNKQLVWVYYRGKLKDSTKDILNSMASKFIYIERDHILILKEKFKCPKCNIELQIKQPRDEIQISCKNCENEIDFFRDHISYWENGRGSAFLDLYPPHRY